MIVLKYFFIILFIASAVEAVEPTFADLAVFCAKNNFKTSIAPDATLKDCVSFLNKHGVCISVFDLMDPSVKVTKEDFARCIGQSVLLLSGEAELLNGCIRKPKEFTSWVDYCVLNDVSLSDLWFKFNDLLEDGPLPEVKSFVR